MPDQYKQYESGPEQSSLESSPPTTPTSEILELENQPPGSESMSQSLSSSGAVTSVVSGMRQSTHRNSQLAMKVKQEITETNDNCKYQSYDRFRCDTNNNSNKNNCINSNVNHKTMIAKQILSVIRNDDFEEFLIILRSKPDLNVFINGQTALHYCLLLGNHSFNLCLNKTTFFSSHSFNGCKAMPPTRKLLVSLVSILLL